MNCPKCGTITTAVHRYCLNCKYDFMPTAPEPVKKETPRKPEKISIDRLRKEWFLAYIEVSPGETVITPCKVRGTSNTKDYLNLFLADYEKEIWIKYDKLKVLDFIKI